MKKLLIGVLLLSTASLYANDFGRNYDSCISKVKELAIEQQKLSLVEQGHDSEAIKVAAISLMDSDNLNAKAKEICKWATYGILARYFEL